MENIMLPEPHKILSVLKETKAEYTFRVEYHGETRHGQFFQLSIPKVGEAPISVSFLEGMNAVAGAAVQVALAERLTEAVHGSARGTVSLVSAFAASSGLLADVTLSANEAVAASLAETLQAAVTGSKDACVTLAALDGLEATIWGSKDIPLSVELADVLEAMRKNRIEPKRLRFVQKNGSSPPWLFLAEGRLGGRPFLQIEAPLLMEDEPGKPSREIERIYTQSKAL